MVRCIVKNCPSEWKRKRGPGIWPAPQMTFHHLPPDDDGRLLWLHRIGRLDLLGNPNLSQLKVCSNHFSSEMWTRGGKRLTQCAIPDIVDLNDRSPENGAVRSPESDQNSIIWLPSDTKSQEGNIQESDIEMQERNFNMSSFDLSATEKTNATVSFLGLLESEQKRGETEISSAQEKSSKSTREKKITKVKISDPIISLRQLLLPPKKEKVKREKKKRKELLGASLLALQNAINDFLKADNGSEKSLNIFGAYLDNELRSLESKSLANVKFQINQILYEASSGAYKNVLIKTIRVPEQPTSKPATLPLVGSLPTIQFLSQLPVPSSVTSQNIQTQPSKGPVKKYRRPRKSKQITTAPPVQGTYTIHQSSISSNLQNFYSEQF